MPLAGCRGSVANIFLPAEASSSMAWRSGVVLTHECRSGSGDEGRQSPGCEAVEQRRGEQGEIACQPEEASTRPDRAEQGHESFSGGV